MPHVPKNGTCLRSVPRGMLRCSRRTNVEPASSDTTTNSTYLYFGSGANTNAAVMFIWILRAGRPLVHQVMMVPRCPRTKCTTPRYRLDCSKFQVRRDSLRVAL